MHTPEYWIEKLELRKHPEGGYFREVYRSEEIIPADGLHNRYTGDRNHSTSIYFLVTSSEFSAFHRIKSDETCHFYAGSAVTLHLIDLERQYSTVRLGPDTENGEVFQFTIPHRVWFAAEVDEPDSYALVGCTVAPGFDFDDFESAKRAELTRLYGQHQEVIGKFTRQ